MTTELQISTIAPEKYFTYDEIFALGGLWNLNHPVCPGAIVQVPQDIDGRPVLGAGLIQFGYSKAIITATHNTWRNHDKFTKFVGTVTLNNND